MTIKNGLWQKQIVKNISCMQLKNYKSSYYLLNCANTTLNISGMEFEFG